MIVDSDSNIAWHRAQLKKNRDAVKALEADRFRIGEPAGSKRQMQKAIAALKRKIAESERCIAIHDRQTRRPVATDLQSLASVRWSNWNTRDVVDAPSVHLSHGRHRRHAVIPTPRDADHRRASAG
jgi:hypothetical protein